MSLPSAAATPSRLVELALATLPAMRLEDGAFCHEVAPPGMQRRGRSLRYTLIVLIGLTRAERAGIRHGFDCGELAELVHDELAAPELRAGDLGLVLWADARLERPASEAVIRRLDELTAAQGGLRRLEGLELSWILIGAAEQLHVAGSERVHDLYEAALGEHLRRSATTGSGLLLHRSRGRRQDFPNFATEIYGVLALARAAQRGDAEALAAARRVAEALLALQRPNGGWPWLYDAQRGVVVEPFEIYSVHQDAMAPVALSALSEVTGDPRWREAALGGLRWLAGENELGATMVDREAGIVYRSIRRRRPLSRGLLYLNTATAYVARPALAWLDGPLELNRTDRPYHLGWVLEAWAG